MLVPTGVGRCLSPLYSCTLLYEITSTPITTSPALQLPQYPLPTYTAALGKSPTSVSNKSYGTTLPSTITNLTSNEWPPPPFSVKIPGVSDCQLQFYATDRKGTFLQKIVLEDLIRGQVVRWRAEQSTSMPAVLPPLLALLILQLEMAGSRDHLVSSPK